MIPGVDYTGVAAAAVLINENKEILLQKRTKECRNEHDHWTIPGGMIEFNEKAEDALVREVEEETGLQIKPLKLLGVCNHILKSEGHHWLSLYYTAEILGGEAHITEPHKNSDMGWFNFDALPKPLTMLAEDAIRTYKKS